MADRVGETARRTDLDWVRIAAFGLLILFHIGMYYGTADWIVNSPHPVPALQLVLDWSTPWRLLLLFIVSGAATRFIAAKLPPGALLKSRSLRLLPPLAFAVVLVIPPELYAQAVEQYGYRGGVLAFWGQYLRATPVCAADGRCLVLPQWDYMWFVAYLWIYTVVLTGTFALFPTLRERLQRIGLRWFGGAGLFVLPVAGLMLARLVLRHYWPETHVLGNDWYLHVVYFACFVFGFLFAGSDAIWQGFARRRHRALGVAVVSYALYAAYTWHYRDADHEPMAARLLMVADYGIDQWAWVAAALGFAHRYLTGRDGPVRRYLTDAIFPFYIVHQTAIVVAAHNLAPLRLPQGEEAAILVAATLASCVVTYEIVRRIAWLRPLFGLKHLPPAAKPGEAPAGLVQPAP